MFSSPKKVFNSPCSTFEPQFWKRTKCKNCFFSLDKHDENARSAMRRSRSNSKSQSSLTPSSSPPTHNSIPVTIKTTHNTPRHSHSGSSSPHDTHSAKQSNASIPSVPTRAASTTSLPAAVPSLNNPHALDNASKPGSLANRPSSWRASVEYVAASTDAPVAVESSKAVASKTATDKFVTMLLQKSEPVATTKPLVYNTEGLDMSEGKKFTPQSSPSKGKVRADRRATDDVRRSRPVTMSFAGMTRIEEQLAEAEDDPLPQMIILRPIGPLVPLLWSDVEARLQELRHAPSKMADIEQSRKEAKEKPYHRSNSPNVPINGRERAASIARTTVRHSPSSFLHHRSPATKRSKEDTDAAHVVVSADLKASPSAGKLRKSKGKKDKEKDKDKEKAPESPVEPDQELRVHFARAPEVISPDQTQSTPTTTTTITTTVSAEQTLPSTIPIDAIDEPKSIEVIAELKPFVRPSPLSWDHVLRLMSTQEPHPPSPHKRNSPKKRKSSKKLLEAAEPVEVCQVEVTNNNFHHPGEGAVRSVQHMQYMLVSRPQS